jgi:hypothetical protein
MTRPIHEITKDHAEWLREHVARQMETEAEFEEMVQMREARNGNAIKSDAHRMRAEVWRDMAQQVRAKVTDSAPSWRATLHKQLTSFWASAQLAVTSRLGRRRQQ